MTPDMEHAERLVGGFGMDDRMPALGQKRGRDLRHLRIVLDEQDAQRLALRERGRCALIGLLGLCPPPWQVEG